MPENKQDTDNPVGNFFKALFTPRTYVMEKKYELMRQEQARNTVLQEFFNAFDNRDIAQIKALQPAIKGYFPELAKELSDVETIIGEAGAAEGILKKVLIPAMGKLAQTQVPGVRATTITPPETAYQPIPLEERTFKVEKGKARADVWKAKELGKAELEASNKRLAELNQLDDMFRQKQQDNPDKAGTTEGNLILWEDTIDEFAQFKGFFPTAEELGDFTPPEVKGMIQATQEKYVKEAEVSSKLRGEFASDSTDFVKVRDAYDRILASAKDPSAAGDLALIFNYMKMLDPASVVRESEFATAANAGGVDERTRAFWNKILTGERLSSNMRADFLARAKELYEAAKRGQRQLVDQYRQLSKVNLVDPRRVIIDYMYEMGGPVLPKGIPEGSFLKGKDRKTGKNIWQTPDGKLYMEE